MKEPTVNLEPTEVVTVLAGLAANAALELSVLRPLWGSPYLSVRLALAGRADLTAPVAEVLARSTEPPVRLALAGNPVAAIHVWQALVTDPDPQVRIALARGHSNHYRPAIDLPLPLPAQQAFADDPDVEVRHALALRRDLSLAMGVTLAADPSARVREAVARCPLPWPEAVTRSLLAAPEPAVRRAALFGTAPPADLVATLLADPETRSATAECATLTIEDVAALVDDEDPDVRTALAGNRHLPAAWLSRLSQDPDDEVRVAMMLRPDLTDESRARIVATVPDHDHHVASWLLPRNASLEVRLTYVGSPFVFCRRAVAFSQDLPNWAVSALAVDEDHSVRLLLAENHVGIPGRILPDLVRRPGHARWELVRHQAMPATTLAEFAASGDEILRRLAACSPNLPATVATALASDADPDTRAYVAANPALPLPEILRLLHDPDPRLAGAAARNPRVPPDLALSLISASRPLSSHGTGGS
jgi:hypothetical protein